MEVYEYAKMYEFERTFWWYRSLRRFIKQDILRLDFQPIEKLHVLDAGCGTGGNLLLLNSLNFKKCDGVDLSPEAVQFCIKNGLKNVQVADVNHLPFADQSFDFVLCSDVFECAEVDEQKAYSELLRVLKPGGHILLLAAAYQFLLSEHDKAVHSVRRYSRAAAYKAFQRSSVAVNVHFYFAFLFPLVASYRLLKNIFSKAQDQAVPQSDLVAVPGIVNALFDGICWLESQISALMAFPFGTTCVIQIKKIGS